MTNKSRSILFSAAHQALTHLSDPGCDPSTVAKQLMQTAQLVLTPVGDGTALDAAIIATACDEPDALSMLRSVAKLMEGINRPADAAALHRMANRLELALFDAGKGVEEVATSGGNQ